MSVIFNTPILTEHRAETWDGDTLRLAGGELALVQIEGAEGAYLQVYDVGNSEPLGTPKWTRLIVGEHMSEFVLAPWMKVTNGIGLRLTGNPDGSTPYEGLSVLLCVRYK